jgi:hypothetical protein
LTLRLARGFAVAKDFTVAMLQELIFIQIVRLSDRFVKKPLFTEDSTEKRPKTGFLSMTTLANPSQQAKNPVFSANSLNI